MGNFENSIVGSIVVKKDDATDLGSSSDAPSDEMHTFSYEVSLDGYMDIQAATEQEAERILDGLATGNFTIDVKGAVLRGLDVGYSDLDEVDGESADDWHEAQESK